MTHLHRLDASGGDPPGSAASEGRRAVSQSLDPSSVTPREHGTDERLSALVTASHQAYTLHESVRLIASYVLQLRKALKEPAGSKMNQLVSCIADRTNQVEAGLNALTSTLDLACRDELEAKLSPSERNRADERH